MIVADAPYTANIRFHELHRWLNPFARQQATLFTHLKPDEIRVRLWPYLAHSYEPNAKKEFLEFADALGSFLTSLPGMTGEERTRAFEHLGRMYRDGDAEGLILEGSAHPGGFGLRNARNDSPSLRATYQTGIQGTTLEVEFGPNHLVGDLSSLAMWIFLISAIFSIVLMDFVYPSSHSLIPMILWRSIPLFGFFVILIFIGIIFTTSVISKWLHRNDFTVFKEFLASVIEAREVGNEP